MFPYPAGECRDHIFHPEVEVGVNDVEFWIDGPDAGDDVVDGKVVFDKIIDAGGYVAIHYLYNGVCHFVDMNKRSMLIATAIDGDLAKEISLEEEAIDHCIDTVGRIVAIDIAGSYDIHLPVAIQNLELALTFPFRSSVKRLWIGCGRFAQWFLVITINGDAAEVNHF